MTLRPPVVLKLGGDLLQQPARLAHLAETIARTSRMRPLVVVHGGGREIDTALVTAGIPVRQIEGVRVTDPPTLDIVVSVLSGLINTRLVAAVVAAGAPGVGLTGADAASVPVKRLTPRGPDARVFDLGLVGEPNGTEPPRLVQHLCTAGYVPLIASLGLDADGTVVNVNADALAADLAVRLRSARLVIGGTTAGVLDEAGRTLRTLARPGVEAFIKAGSATAGMIAKLRACVRALTGGVAEVIVADATGADPLDVLIEQGWSPDLSACTRFLLETA